MLEELRRLCNSLLITAKRVGIEVNKAEIEFFVVSRIRHGNISLEVEGFGFYYVTEYATYEDNINRMIRSDSLRLQILIPLFRSRTFMSSENVFY